MSFMLPKNTFVASYMITEHVFQLFCDHRTCFQIVTWSQYTFLTCFVIKEHVYNFQARTRRIYCLRINSLTCFDGVRSVQYDAFRAVWCFPCSMMCSVQYDVFRAVWCVPCSMMCSVQYNVFRAVWCVPHYESNIFHNQSLCNNTVPSSAETRMRRKSLCDGLVTRSDEYYRVCVCVCDLETSKLGGLVPIWAGL
jgi:hypothetical protein